MTEEATVTVTVYEQISPRVAVLRRVIRGGKGRAQTYHDVTLDGAVIKRCGGCREERLDADSFARGLAVGLATPLGKDEDGR